MLRIGDPDRYVHGQQTYVITYEVRDVTKNFGGYDEIFWNTNGTQWSQPSGSITARLHVDKKLAFRDQPQRCVQGYSGSQEACQTTVTDKSDERIVTFSATRPLQSHENISFMASFDAGTFAAYVPGFWERIFPALRTFWWIFNGTALLVLIAYSLRIWHAYGRPPKGKSTVVPEYLPPKDVSILAAGSIIRKPSITAQILDLAVRHYLKIYELEDRTFLHHKKVYLLELAKPLTGLRSDESLLLENIFGATAAVYDRVNTKELGTSLQERMTRLKAEVGLMTTAHGFYVDRTSLRRQYNRAGRRLLLLSLVLISPGLLLGVGIYFIFVNSLKPLSAKGVATGDHLEGLKMYMKLTEADRLRALQSPEGAQKISAGTDPTDKKQLVRLYERLLPFAVLYGMEKAWARQLAPLYDQAPEWYAGSNWSTFNASVFAASLSNFTNVSNTTFAPPSDSASGGSSGGSGGGGGGGGGGGW